jgi:hypothetical protein
MELAAKADSKLRACVRKGEAKHGYRVFSLNGYPLVN